MKRACAAASVVAMAAVGVLAQPVQWRVEDGGNGHWYQLVPVDYTRDWAHLRNSCFARGGHLATVTSAAENSFISTSVVVDPPGDGSLLGGYVAVGGRSTTGWEWITAEPWSYQQWAVNCPGGPENERHVYMIERYHRWGEGGRWDDSPWGYLAVVTAVIEWSADCNNDGIVDKGQILSGQLPDANNNGIPDWSVSITRQPVDQAVGVDQPVFFAVETQVSSGCSTPVVYRWQRRNPQVADESAPNAWIDLQDGGGFLNTGTASLTILRPTPALATGYRCRISGGCGCEGTVAGVAYTDTVNFGVACPADFNADGGIDFADVEAFFERWENGC